MLASMAGCRVEGKDGRERAQERLGPHRLLRAVAGRSASSARRPTSIVHGVRLVAAGALPRALRLRRRLGDRGLSSALRAPDLRVSPGRPGLLSVLRRHGAAELDPRTGPPTTGCTTATSTTTGTPTTSSAAAGGRTSSGSSTRARPTGRSTTCRTCRRTRSCGSSTGISSLIGIVCGLGIPTLIGWAFGDPLGGLLWGGFLRVVVIHHTTFFVNSIAHLYGTRPYTEENSARDNPWVALVTNGEGYHNFHHRFPTDFRNGLRWYQWDPSKWWIRGLARRRAGPAAAPHARPGDRALAPPDGDGTCGEGARRRRRRTSPTRSGTASSRPITRSSAPPRSGTRPPEKRRKDWKEYREHLALARGHWRAALRLLARAPEGA